MISLDHVCSFLITFFLNFCGKRIDIIFRCSNFIQFCPWNILLNEAENRLQLDCHWYWKLNFFRVRSVVWFNFFLLQGWFKIFFWFGSILELFWIGSWAARTLYSRKILKMLLISQTYPSHSSVFANQSLNSFWP